MNPRTFGPFLAARILSTLGRQMLSVAVGWDLYDRTHSFVVLGLVGLAQVTPVVLLAVFAGTAIDRFDARRTGSLACALLGVTGALFAYAKLTTEAIEPMFALLVVNGIAMAFYAPSLSSIVPRLVDKDSRARANALVSTGFELASLGGPAAAGAILALTNSAATIYEIQAVAQVAMCALLATYYVRGIASPDPSSSSSSSTRMRDMVAGVRFVFSSPLLLPALSLDLFAVLFGGVTALLPAFAKDILHAGPDGLGFLRASPAAGAMAMALVTTYLPPWKRAGRALFAAVAGFVVCTLAFSFSTWLPLSCLALACAGACDEVSVIIRMTLEQMVTPDSVRGRVSSVRYVFIGMSNELGELESGLAAAAFGAVGSVVVGCVASFVVVAAVAAKWPQLLRLGALADLKPDDRADDRVNVADGAVSRGTSEAPAPPPSSP